MGQRAAELPQHDARHAGAPCSGSSVVGAEGDVKLGVHGLGQPGQQRHGRSCPAQFQPRQLRLGHPGARSQLGLGKAQRDAPVVNHLTQQQRSAGLSVRSVVTLRTGTRPAGVPATVPGVIAAAHQSHFRS
jgi:hypothetical protein